jgi:hypothetical protein
MTVTIRLERKKDFADQFSPDTGDNIKKFRYEVEMEIRTSLTQEPARYRCLLISTRMYLCSHIARRWHLLFLAID